MTNLRQTNTKHSKPQTQGIKSQDIINTRNVSCVLKILKQTLHRQTLDMTYLTKTNTRQHQTLRIVMSRYCCVQHFLMSSVLSLLALFCYCLLCLHIFIYIGHVMSSVSLSGFVMSSVCLSKACLVYVQCLSVQGLLQYLQ